MKDAAQAALVIIDPVFKPGPGVRPMTAVLPRPASTPIAEEDDAPQVVSDALYRSLSMQHPDLRIEQTADGEVVIMAPAYSDTGLKNSELSGQLYVWNKQACLGYVFDSSTGFTFPNGAKRSPDTSWIEKSRWDALTAKQKKDFAPICPDFVAELRSESDRLTTLQKKMHEYATNGVRLGWLIDPRLKRAEIYRPGRDVEALDNPTSLSGEDVLPGFTLDLTEIWE
jgi:Uma2 family endonuclease